MKMKKRTLWKKSVINLMCLALLIAYFPLGNFTEGIVEANDDVTSTENISETKVREEIVSKRTANSKTYLNPDGTYTSEISQTPIHYKNSRNTWSEIQSNLIENTSEENYQNKANSFKAKLDKKIDKDTPMLQVEDQDRSIKLELAPVENTGKEPAEVTGIVDDNSVKYPEIYQNVSLTYTIGADRIKEDIVFDERPSSGFPDKFTYKMDLVGLYAKEVEGILYLYDKDTNEPIYYFETPYMYDSYKPEGFQTAKEITSIPEEAISYDVKLEHKVIDGQLYLYLIPSKAWLEDPERIYPITIDPTIVRLQSSNYVQDTNLRSTFPTQTGGNDLELGGGASNGNIIRSLIKFDLSSIPGATHILSSSLNLWFSSTNGSSPVDISLFKVSRDWEENQASWNYAMTSPSVAWTNKGGDYVVSNKLATVKGLTSPTSLDIDMKKWEVPTHIIQNWKGGTDPNHGFLVKSDSESINIYKKFISSEHTLDSKYHPLLVVTYRTNARLGLEDYWDYDTHELVGGTNFVNLTTSNNVVQYDDMSLVGRGGFDFNFTRTYNSKSQESSALGYGWSFTGNEKLFLNIKGNGNILNYQEADGTNIEFTYDAQTATYYASAGRYETIKNTAIDEYTLYFTNGEKTIFKIRDTRGDTDVKTAYITNQMDLNGNKINYQYNDLHQLTKISTDLGESMSKSLNLRYNSKGLIEEIKYDNRIIYYKYTNGYLENVDVLKNSIGTWTTTQFIYQNNLLNAIIDPNKRKTSFTYENGNITMVQEPQVDQVIDESERTGTVYSIDIPNKQATVTDPEGNTTSYLVNDNYVIIKSIDPLGKVTNYELDSNYNVLSIKETENGISTIVRTNTYEKGQLLTSIDAEGNKETNVYTTTGKLKTHTDTNGKVSTYDYDEKGNMKKSIIPHNDEFLTTVYEYDLYGDIQVMRSSDGITDEFNLNYQDGLKTTKHTDVNGIVTEHTTDLSGNMLSQTDGKGQITSYNYNLQNELDSITDAKNKKTSYQYDDNGNLRFITNAQNAVTELQYNGRNLIQKEINALGNTTSYIYDDNGNITGVTKPNGETIHTDYDEENRIKTIKAGDNTLWNYIYENGLVTILSGNNAPLRTLEYFDNGLLKSINYHDGNSLIEFNYLGDQYLSNISHSSYYNQSTKLEYVPDESYKTKEIKRNDVSIVSLGYEKTGLPETISFNNGSKYNKGYQNGRLDNETIYTNPTITYQSFKYAYDNNNNITGITTNNGTISYDYDALNQLTKETLLDGTEIVYDYDDAGNRTLKKVTKNGQTTTIISQFNKANQLEKIGDKILTYDKNGNIKSDGEYTYYFNEFDQLIKIQDSTGKTIAEYGYNEEGNRDFSKNSQGTTLYQYNGDKVLYETDGNNNVIKEYTYDDNGTPLTMTYRGVMYYYLTNYRGDVLGLTDKDGKVVAAYTYDAWGNILSQSGELSAINPYRYAGYRYDDETKLYYLIARYYNPENGSFLSLDPVRGDLMEPLTLNGYSYVNNNPVMFNDPSGESAKELLARVKYGFKQALKLLLESWGVPRGLGEKIVSSAVAFIGGTATFRRFTSKNVGSYNAYKSQVRLISQRSGKSLIRYAKQSLRRALGKRAVSMMIGGVGGIVAMEATIFTYNVIYYALAYKPKK
ncbi:DNRLRE domain-containing protein [Mesobacillus subterraneus]|uniref:DNRLRE domain-containing protein n=1 Tax=Mesobacillus subterraneus TaxID=285983 RepID=UPI0020411847|nr:DNRLRE domain-containing protein [Mesobacillus subterraneus]MCM3576466.1 DNRLRE domain-containing protein [Mesobacillus subterraneus]